MALQLAWLPVEPVDMPDDDAGCPVPYLRDHRVVPGTAAAAERGYVVVDEHPRVSDAQLRAQGETVLVLTLSTRLLAHAVLRDLQIDLRIGH